MEQMEYDSSASGYLANSFEGISSVFTDVEVLTSSPTHIVARAKRYGRWWLLKGLRDEVAGQEAYRQRLRKEFEILMQLQHPAVVAAMEMADVETMGTCIVMEFIDGITLAEWLRGKTTRGQRVEVARRLAMAVEYVHSKNIVHRDLKPENIIVTRNGENVKLIDFGLADTDSHTVLKQPAGTLRYISPEQMQTPVADVRNDIYSLGVIFSQMNLRYGRLARKCLKSAEKRYQNMGELLAAMEARKRRPARIAAGVATVVVALLCAVVATQAWLLQKIRAEQEYREVEHETLKTEYERQIYSRSRVEHAIQTGYGTIDSTLQALGIEQIIDTLSYQIYLPADYYDRVDRFNRAVNAYTNDIDSSFTDAERTEISAAIYMYGSKAILPVTEQLLNKPSYPQQQ